MLTWREKAAVHASKESGVDRSSRWPSGSEVDQLLYAGAY